MSYYNNFSRTDYTNVKKENNNQRLVVEQGQLMRSASVPTFEMASSEESKCKQVIIESGVSFINVIEKMIASKDYFKQVTQDLGLADNSSIELEKMIKPSEYTALAMTALKMVDLTPIFFSMYHILHFGSSTDYKEPALAAIQKLSSEFYIYLSSKEWFRSCNFPILPVIQNNYDPKLAYAYRNYLTKSMEFTRPFNIAQNVGKDNMNSSVNIEGDKVPLVLAQFILIIRILDGYFDRKTSIKQCKQMYINWGNFFLQVPFSGSDLTNGWFANFDRLVKTYLNDGR